MDEIFSTRWQHAAALAFGIWANISICPVQLRCVTFENVIGKRGEAVGVTDVRTMKYIKEKGEGASNSSLH